MKIISGRCAVNKKISCQQLYRLKLLLFIIFSYAILFALNLFAASQSELPFFNICNFGAVGDGARIDTKAIQTAIDTCARSGGGTVFFPSGQYLSGTLFLKSNVTIFLDAGAILLGSKNLADYPQTICEYRSYTDNYTVRSLIYAEKVHNISITGRGTIDGQGASFKTPKPHAEHYKERPYLIRIIECNNVTVRDVTIQNSAMWVQHYLACDNVNIDGIAVHSVVNHNNDGIDIDSCHKVRISNCEIYSGDDAIVLKATSNRDCRDVTVTNCVLSSRGNAFKLGTESNGGFQNITMNNCTIYDTRECAIALEEVDGGTLERVNVDNIVIRNSGGAIFLRLGNRARPFTSKGPGGPHGTFIMKPGTTRPGMGSFRQVIISNVQAVGIDSIGCSITGLPGHPVEDITLQNIRIQFHGGGTQNLVDREIPEREESYPSYRMFDALPSYGFFCRHANNVKFDHVQLEFKKDDVRPAMIFQDADNLDVSDIMAQSTLHTKYLLAMTNVKNAFVHNCGPKSAAAFLNIENSSDIAVMNNNFSQVKTIYRKSSEAKNIFVKYNRQ